MRRSSPLPSLPLPAQIAMGLLVLGSLAVFLLAPTGTVDAASCPPGWSSCGSFYVQGCCSVLGHSFTNYQQKCHTWDHDVNAYPTCTYKVVATWYNNDCRSPYC